MRRLIGGNRQSEMKSEMIEFKFHYRSSYDLDDSIVERTQLSSTRGAILFTTVGELELRLTFKTQMYLDPGRLNRTSSNGFCCLRFQHFRPDS